MANKTRHSSLGLQIKPGLSAHKDKPKEAADSLRQLLDKALEVVPVTLRPSTPVCVGVSTGLGRLDLRCWWLETVTSGLVVHLTVSRSVLLCGLLPPGYCRSPPFAWGCRRRDSSRGEAIAALASTHFLGPTVSCLQLVALLLAVHSTPFWCQAEMVSAGRGLGPGFAGRSDPC